jgi:hypothetical protein
VCKTDVCETLLGPKGMAYGRKKMMSLLQKRLRSKWGTPGCIKWERVRESEKNWDRRQSWKGGCTGMHLSVEGKTS